MFPPSLKSWQKQRIPSGAVDMLFRGNRISSVAEEALDQVNTDAVQGAVALKLAPSATVSAAG